MEVIGASPGQPLCRAREVFAEAVETPPDLRQAVLEAACGGDAGLRREVAGLLGAYDAAIDLLLGAGDDAGGEIGADGILPLQPDPAATGPAATAGDRVGPYR